MEKQQNILLFLHLNFAIFPHIPYLCAIIQSDILMIKSEYPSVLLIYTGGTIGMIENPETGALEAFNFGQLQENVPELKRFNYRISSYQFNPPIDSSDMEPSLWANW